MSNNPEDNKESVYLDQINLNSVSSIQRHLGIGYTKAMQLKDRIGKALEAERDSHEKTLKNSEIYQSLLGRIEDLKKINELSEPFKRILDLETKNNYLIAALKEVLFHFDTDDSHTDEHMADFVEKAIKDHGPR